MNESFVVRRNRSRGRYRQQVSGCRQPIFPAILLLILLLFIPSAVVAQNIAEPQWGIMAPLEMGRDCLTDDPAAAAAVVFDKGDLIVGPGFNFSLLRRCRIQIFGPAGYPYATAKIPYRRGEKIINLEAHTLTPDGRRVPVPQKRIYKIDNGPWRALVFAFPEVTPGSVVEYRYELQSRDFYYLRPWIFQTDIPTEFSRLVVHVPPGFEYAAVVNGYDRVSSPLVGSYYSAEHRNTKIKTYGWSAENLPALRPVDYLSSLEDYRVRLDFQIVSYRTRYSDRTFIDTWPDLIERVRGWYDGLLSLPPKKRREIAGLPDQTINPQAYAQAVYQFCRDSIAFIAGSGSVSAEDLRSAEKVLSGRRGNSVEKNLLLVSLLRAAGRSADPVLISTRDHLHFDPRDHRLDQFNHVIVRLAPLRSSPTVQASEAVFLDAADPAGWFGFLSPSTWVDQGVWIAPDTGAIVDIPQPADDHTAKLRADLWLEPDGTARGRIQGTLTGYRAWEWSHDGLGRGFEDFVKSTWITPHAELEIWRITTPGEVNGSSLQFSMEFLWRNAAMVGAECLYFRPAGLFGLPENPFIDPERRFPVSFAYPYFDRTQIVWHLPEGYHAAEIPRGGGKHAPSLNYTCVFSTTGKIVIVERRLSVERRDFYLPRYGELQNFFEAVVEIDRGLAVGVSSRSTPTAVHLR